MQQSGDGQNWFREQRAEETGRVWLLFFDGEEAYKTSRCGHMKHAKKKPRTFLHEIC
jgi:hypothetical protein